MVTVAGLKTSRAHFTKLYEMINPCEYQLKQITATWEKMLQRVLIFYRAFRGLVPSNETEKFKKIVLLYLIILFDIMKNFNIQCVQFFSFTALAQFYDFGSRTPLKVSSNRKKFVTFHRRKHLTNFEISNIYKKNIQEHISHSFIFSFSTKMSMSMSIIVFTSSWKLYSLVAITSGFRMNNIPVINRLESGMQKKVWIIWFKSYTVI